jgi:hypothetical protein
VTPLADDVGSRGAAIGDSILGADCVGAAAADPLGDDPLVAISGGGPGGVNPPAGSLPPLVPLGVALNSRRSGTGTQIDS